MLVQGPLLCPSRESSSWPGGGSSGHPGMPRSTHGVRGGLWLCFLEGPPSPAFNEKAIPPSHPPALPSLPYTPLAGHGDMDGEEESAGGGGGMGGWGGGGGACRSVGGG